MKFGLFYEHQLPRPWDTDSEYRLIQDALEQIEYADRIGIDYAWEVEHHFLEEYSHSSAPEVFLAAASQRTRRIRLGHGIVQTPPPFNHPARIAERISMLDLVSNGRVDFGTGESSSEAELGGFMIDPSEKRAMWEEGLRVAVRCMTEEPFTAFSGQHVTMPPRNVVPNRARSRARRCGSRVGQCDTIHVAPQLRDQRPALRSSIRKKRGTGSTTTTDARRRRCADRWRSERRRGVRPDVHVPRRRGRSAAATRDRRSELLGYSLAHYYVFGRHQPARTQCVGRVPSAAERGYDPEAVILAAQPADRLGAKVVEQGVGGLRGAVGTPDQIREYLLRYEECGVDQVIFCFQAGKNRHEHIMEALELFGREVLPEFADNAESRERDKQQRLAPVIDAVMERKPAADLPAAADRRLCLPGDARAMADRAGNDDFQKMLDDFARQTAVGPGGIEGLLR